MDLREGGLPGEFDGVVEEIHEGLANTHRFAIELGKRQVNMDDWFV